MISMCATSSYTCNCSTTAKCTCQDDYEKLVGAFTTGGDTVFGTNLPYHIFIIVPSIVEYPGDDESIRPHRKRKKNRNLRNKRTKFSQGDFSNRQKLAYVKKG